MMLSWTRENNEEGIGRRRQHSGGLALASDQIPGLAQHNIHSGLVTFHAGLARPFANRLLHPTPDRQEKASFEAKKTLVSPR